jgi:uncharacterized protein (DUF433 family)
MLGRRGHMSAAATTYVQLRDGFYYVGSSRVSLRSVVEGWKRGETPEHIQEGYPSLTLAQVFGAIAFYLEHQEEVEESFRTEDTVAARYRAISEEKNAEFLATMRQRIADHRAKQAKATPESTEE